jgi:Uncharacterized protein conserved in bacteria
MLAPVVNPYPEMTIAVGDDIFKRRCQPLSDFDPEDRNFLNAYNYWQSKRKDGLLPSRRDIDIIDLRPLIGYTHVIDVGNAAAGEFFVRIRGGNIRTGAAFNKPNVIDIESQAMRQALLEDYQTVCFTGVPSYHYVVACVDFIRYSYSRLILPMANDGRTVDTLMIFINKREFKDFSV